jgi:hypothetical protein
MNITLELQQVLRQIEEDYWPPLITDSLTDSVSLTDSASPKDFATVIDSPNLDFSPTDEDAVEPKPTFQDGLKEKCFFIQSLVEFV